MKQFALRQWAIEDVKSLVKYANNKNIAKNMTNKFPHPYSEENAKSFIEFAKTATTSYMLAIEVDGEAAGGIGLHFQDDIQCKNAELGYWLAEPYWGSGIVARAIMQMVDIGFNKYDISRIFARPFGSNVASQIVLEKAGFKLEAKLEKTLFKNSEYHDEMIYAVRKKDYNNF